MITFTLHTYSVYLLDNIISYLIFYAYFSMQFSMYFRVSGSAETENDSVFRFKLVLTSFSVFAH